MPMPATPAMPTQENSSARNTFSMSRWEIMLPAVARRSPAITTPPLNAAAVIVVACGRLAARSRPAATDAPEGGRAEPAPGSSPGAAPARKSANDDVP